MEWIAAEIVPQLTRERHAGSGLAGQPLGQLPLAASGDYARR